MSRPDGFIHLFYQNGLPVMVGYQGHYRQWLRHARVLLAERLKGWQGYLLAVDDNGSVLKGLTASGEDAAHRFTAYGHDTWQPSACTQAGFKGERLDAVTRGYFLGNGYRLHMPTLMRFNAPDSLSPFNEGGLNAYAYCGGDPINHEDPSGHAFGFKIRTRGYRTSFNAALRRRPAPRIDIPGKLASHAEHLFNSVLDYLPSDALENLSKANPAFEPIIAKRSSRNLDVFMQTL